MTILSTHPSSPVVLPERRPVVPRLGILNDYVRIPYANGSSFASQFLYREFRQRGSEVVVIGPHDPKARPEDLPPKHVCFRSLPLRNHPGVHLPMPSRAGLRRLAEADLSLVVAQTGSALLDAGLWLRRNHGVPMVCVNTIHLPSVYDVLLPEAIHENRLAHAVFQRRLVPWVERKTAEVYNGSDALVVLSEGLKEYWRQRGVTVPIAVISRSVEPNIFDRHPATDPFPTWARRGGRLLVVCRHTREKNVVRLLKIFAKHIAPKQPDASLTLVGDGPDHDYFKAQARRLRIADRCVFPGEVTLTDTPAWYRHADVFVYTSLSETYGQVVSEALWCGLPAVAFADHMGVSDQVSHESDGFLVDPRRSDADETFAHQVLRLLGDPAMRQEFSKRAADKAHRRSDPQRCISAYEDVFAQAKESAQRNFGAPSRFELARPVMHWAALHMLLAALGCVRPPAIVNRHGRRQPLWDAFDATAGSERRVERVNGGGVTLRLVS